MTKRSQIDPVVTWVTQTQFICTVARGDQRIAVAVQPSPESKWQVLALVARDGVDVEGALDDHAHKVVGLYDSPASAIAAAESFAIAWVKDFKATRTEHCACTELR